MVSNYFFEKAKIWSIFSHNLLVYYCQFHQCFLRAFLYEIFGAKISNEKASFVVFGAKILYERRARKT